MPTKTGDPCEGEVLDGSFIIDGMQHTIAINNMWYNRLRDNKDNDVKIDILFHLDGWNFVKAYRAAKQITCVSDW